MSKVLGNHPALEAHCVLGYVRLRICTVTYLFYLLQWGISNSSSLKYELREYLNIISQIYLFLNMVLFVINEGYAISSDYLKYFSTTLNL